MANDLNLIDKLSMFLGFSTAEIEYIVKTMSRRYKRYFIPKRSGGSRTILHPCKQIKALQYAANEILLSSLEVHEIACAYVPGKKSPLRTSALKHKDHSYTARIDFRDFFPSLHPSDLFARVQNTYDIDDSDKQLLGKILFFSRQKNATPYLPIGAPTSPVISNAVMLDLDDQFYRISQSLDQDSAITRYADDLYFSTNTKGLCKRFHDDVAALLRRTPSPNLQINEDKTLYLSKGTKRVINGLFITPDGRVSIGRERKKKIKSLIYKHSKTPLFPEELQRAQGMLAFIQDAEPEFYNKLALKYGEHFFSIKDAPLPSDPF